MHPQSVEQADCEKPAPGCPPGKGLKLLGDRKEKDTRQGKKVKIRCITWNVRGFPYHLQDSGKPRSIIKALEHYKVNMAVLLETKHTSTEMKVTEHANWKIWEAPNENKNLGIALATPGHVKNVKIENILPGRIAKFTLKQGNRTFGLTAIHAPTNTDDPEVRDAFWDALRENIKASRRSINLYAGDFNADLRKNYPNDEQMIATLATKALRCHRYRNHNCNTWWHPRTKVGRCLDWWLWGKNDCKRVERSWYGARQKSVSDHRPVGITTTPMMNRQKTGLPKNTRCHWKKYSQLSRKIAQKYDWTETKEAIKDLMKECTYNHPRSIGLQVALGLVRNRKSLDRLIRSSLNGWNNRVNHDSVKELGCTAARRPTIAIAHNRELLTDTKAAELLNKHFETMLNVENRFQPNLENENKKYQQADDIPPPTMKEVRRAISKCANRKAPGDDGIPVEALKNGPVWMTACLHEEIRKVWEGATPKPSWRHSKLIPVFKKGDRSNVLNYRGIALLTLEVKVLGRILSEILCHQTRGKTTSTQAGFIEGKSCSTNIALLKAVLEQMWNRGVDCMVVSIDLRAAFDTVPRSLIWHALRYYGVSENVVKVIHTLHSNTTAKCDKARNSFEYRGGVKQGDSLAPTLFRLGMSYIIETWRAPEPLRLNEKTHLSTIEYADDILLFTTAEHARININSLYEHLNYAGLQVNHKKTQVLSSKVQTLELTGGEKETQTCLQYLGISIDYKGKMTSDWQKRRARTKAAMSKLAVIWKSQLDTEMKLRVLTGYVLPILLYACETWAPKYAQAKQINSTIRVLMRWSLGWRWQDKIRNMVLARQIPKSMQHWLVAIHVVEVRTLLFVNRIWKQRQEDQLCRWLIHQNCSRKRKPGGKLQTWQDYVNGLTGKITEDTCNKRWWCKVLNGMIKTRSKAIDAWIAEAEDRAQKPMIKGQMECDECGRRYMTQKGLTQHKRLAHTNTFIEQIKINSGENTERKDKKEKKIVGRSALIQCEDCGRYSTKSGLSRHKCKKRAN